jgi:general secretion pathway protein D
VKVQEVGIMRPQEVLSFLGSVLSTGVALCILFSSGVAPASATSSEPIYLENVDIQTVVKQVAALTGITFLFNPEQVRGKITVLSPKGVSPTEALDLLKSALALHGYTLLSKAEATWIVPVDQVPFEAFTIKVVPLDYARAGELAYTLSWIAPPSVRVVPYYPTNSLIISGHPAAVEALVRLIK